MTNYTPRLPLKQHQLQALKECAAKPSSPCSVNAFAYLMDMGTGKSATVLAEWGDMAVNGGPKDLLLIAPKSSIRNWYADKGDDEGMWSEIRKHCPEDFQERLMHHTWVGTDTVEWRDKMRRLMSVKDRPRALFMNVEALSNGKNDDALNLCKEFVGQRNAMVVVDESTTIKGRSNRTDAVIEIGANAGAKRILSGLWTPNSPLDLYYQCAFLDPKILGHRNFFTFQRRYATVIMQPNFATGRKYPQITGYINQDELRDKVAKYSYRVLKKDCLDLAPKIYTSRDVELTAEQKRMLKEIRSFGHARIETGGDEERFVTTDMVIKRIIRELQIGLGYVMDDEERALHEVPEYRTKALLEVLEEHVGKAIIWCPWQVPLAKIVKTLEKEYGISCVAQFHGGNVAARSEEEHRFLNDPQCRFMCATQGAGMRGNNWTVADLVVYYANNYDLEMRDQSEDRAHRIGQVNRVTYVDLIAQGTIEHKVVKALRRKIDLATMINREGHRAWLI